MNAQIGAKLANVEAALIQIVGTEATTACESCQKEFGPFSHCITAPGALDCGNCHWSSNSSRCTLPPTPIPTPTPTSHRRTFSEEQRGQWETKRAELYADKARLEQSKAALAEKIRDLHKKVDLVPRVFSRLGFVGQTTETSRIFDEGCDKVADVHDAINELQTEQDAVMNALLANQQEALSLLDIIF
jgi:hypothetical protein